MSALSLQERASAQEQSFMPCAACGVGTRTEYGSLHVGVWQDAARSGERFLCLGCIEDRIGRPLVPNDFDDAPVNRWPLMSRGDRQRSPLLGLHGFVLSDADIPRAWSARFLDQLGLSARYAYWTDHPDQASPVLPL